jgi:sporulation protein YlmC with PRC-barrel domain
MARTKDTRPRRLSELIRCQIVRRDGSHLGHLFDIRARRERDALVVTQLVFGMPGLIERMGLKRAKTKCVPWEAVLQVSAQRIVIDESHVVEQD